jgi:hypothetical protein
MKHWLAAFAALTAAGGAGPCLAQAGPAPAASATPAAPAAELDPERLAIANEVIDLSFPPAGRSAMLMRAVDTMTAQLRSSLAEATGGDRDEGADRILDRFLARIRVQTERLIAEHFPPIFAALARAYARTFTRDELVQIRAFVSTPAGRRYIQQSMELLADPDIARANTAYMTSVFTAMQPLQADLRRELQEYLRGRDRPPRRTPRS